MNDALPGPLPPGWPARSRSAASTRVDFPYACLIGAPRSGTTALGALLSTHPDVGYLFEPYFIWDRAFGPLADDRRTAAMATPRVATAVRRELRIFHRKTGRRLLLEKSPFSSFRVPLVNAVFPHAKFIHILRDGRDVALSTHRKWIERLDYTEHGNYRRFLSEVRDKLHKRPYLRTKLQAIRYELRHNVRWRLHGYYAAYYGGHPGWGVRYPGFEADLASHTLLQFNALQWRRSVEQIAHDFERLPEARKLTVRYEDLVTDPVVVVSRVLRFLGLAPSSAMDFGGIDDRRRVTGTATPAQLDEMMPYLSDPLRALGYLDRDA